VIWSVVLYEARVSWRELIPSTWLRRGTLLLIVLVSVAASVALAVAPTRVFTRSAASIDTFAGLLAANVLLASAVALHAATRFVQNPQRLRALQLAPLRESEAILASLGGLLTATAAPLGVFFMPFVILSFRVAPHTAPWLLVAAAAAAAWSMAGALWLVVAATRALGRERTVAFGHVLAIALGFVFMRTFAALTHVTPRPGVMVAFLGISAAAAPGALVGAARRLATTIHGVEPLREAPEPRWGKPSWLRILMRTPAPWAMASMGAVALVVGRSGAPLASGTTAALIILWATLPLNHLLDGDACARDRWRLAPEGWRYQRRLFGQVALLVVPATALLGATAAWGHWAWLGAVVSLAAAAQALFLVEGGMLRSTLLTALVAMAFATEVL